jgi:hypothetical protein
VIEAILNAPRSYREAAETLAGDTCISLDAPAPYSAFLELERADVTRSTGAVFRFSADSLALADINRLGDPDGDADWGVSAKPMIAIIYGSDGIRVSACLLPKWCPALKEHLSPSSGHVVVCRQQPDCEDRCYFRLVVIDEQLDPLALAVFTSLVSRDDSPLSLSEAATLARATVREV